MTFGLVEIDSKEEGDFDIEPLVVEARCCIGSEHDQVSTNQMHLHKAAHEEHCEDSIVLAKGIF